MISRLLLRLLWFGAGTLALTVMAVVYFSGANLAAYGGDRGVVDPVDAILVLGASVDGDGLIGFSSRRRVKAAFSLLESGRASYLIFSGGIGDKHSGVSAADLMRDYAIVLGAPADRLITEPQATTTFENLRFSFAIAEARGFSRLAILTDAFHLERARALAAFFGRPDVALAAADGFRDDSLANRTVSILREALAWWYNLGKIAAWQALCWMGLDVEREKFVR
jgi:uncharacterized SAM-binding protein YcdF (DUF218 family)